MFFHSFLAHKKRVKNVVNLFAICMKRAEEENLKIITINAATTTTLTTTVRQETTKEKKTKKQFLIAFSLLLLRIVAVCVVVVVTFLCKCRLITFERMCDAHTKQQQ